MAAVKTIAIIGATGNMGSAIAKSLVKKGDYRLLLMSDEHDKLAGLKSVIEQSSAKTEVFSMSCARDASWEADIIILA
ncbi:MAG TPA: NAD(P)-binding domain-containing protein, partial [Cyclobacteriaceae bacterium]|nr:NAD(P)-binding domain-containing protein [Cyclobacteriaceae bacterium]